MFLVTITNNACALTMFGGALSLVARREGKALCVPIVCDLGLGKRWVLLHIADRTEQEADVAVQSSSAGGGEGT